MQRQSLAGGEHELYACKPVHVRNLMWIADHSSSSVRHHGVRVLGWQHQAALDVHMSIDKARRDILTIQVDGLAPAIRPCVPRHTGHASAENRYLSRVNLPRKDVDQPPAADPKPGVTITTRHYAQRQHLPF